MRKKLLQMIMAAGFVGLSTGCKTHQPEDTSVEGLGFKGKNVIIWADVKELTDKEIKAYDSLQGQYHGLVKHKACWYQQEWETKAKKKKKKGGLLLNGRKKKPANYIALDPSLYTLVYNAPLALPPRKELSNLLKRKNTIAHVIDTIKNRRETRETLTRTKRYLLFIINSANFASMSDYLIPPTDDNDQKCPAINTLIPRNEQAD